jgi:uncharacterized membrane protein
MEDVSYALCVFFGMFVIIVFLGVCVIGAVILVELAHRALREGKMARVKRRQARAEGHLTSEVAKGKTHL